MAKRVTTPRTLRIARWAIVVLTVALASLTARASSVSPTSTNLLAEYSIRSWQHEHGLPDASVPALLQTSDGYLWIGTRAGLARYDGVRFVAFNRANTPEMENEICQALAEDREGALWVGTEDGLLCRRAGAWTRYTAQGGLPATNVWSLCATRDGSVWIGTGMGLARFQQGQLATFAGTNEPGRCKVMALHEDSDGTLWIGTSRGLFRRDSNSGKFDRDFQPPKGPEPYVSGVFRDPAGHLWAASLDKEDYGVWLWCFEDGKWRLAITTSVAGVREVRMAAEVDGTIWIPVLGHPDSPAGLWRGSERVCLPFPLPTDAFRQSPLDLSVDREGNIWAGMFKGGLLRLEPRRLRVLSAEDGLPHDIAWTVCEAHDGSVWVGTDGGVSQLKGGRFVHYSQTNGLVRNEVRAVAETGDGTIWVGTMNGLDAIRDGQVSHVRFSGEWFETKIRALLPARDGALWVGTVRGLTRLHEGRQTKYTPADGLGGEEVRALLEDRSGHLWVGTFGGGLSCLREGKFTTLSTTNGLSNNNVWALHEDTEGVLWIGTERGLNRLKDGQITVFTRREGLPDDLVNTLVEDNFGRLWVGHDHGIYSVSRQELNAVAAGQARSVTAVCYDETDGLLSHEVNGQKSFPAACKTRDGRLWIATAHGVAIVNPAKVSVDATPPVAVIEEVRANGETVFDNSRAATHLPSGLGFRTSGLKLPPGGGRVLEFRYTAPAFVAAERVRFRYRVAGMSPNWIDVGARREVLFTDLRPGQYEFELIAANHHGVWPDRGARMRVQLSPYFYQTWWFYVVCGIAAAALVGGIVTWRLGELRRIHRLEQQAAIAAERTRIAKDLHDGLGADLSCLTLLADLASDESSTDKGEHVQKLSRTSRRAARDLKEVIWLANPANDTVDGLISCLCQTAEDLLCDARVRCRLDVVPSLPQHPLSIEQRRNLLLVVREALNNIIKHAGATEVWLRASTHDGGLHLVIEDNGRGFDPATVQPGTLGLVSMRQRIEALGGTFKLESRPGTGTKITMEINLAYAQ